MEELTDVYTTNNYPQWNRYKRKKKETERLEKVSPEAQTIKYADLMDNTSEIVQQDPDFAKRYLEEARKVLRRLKKGNSILRERAIEHVKTGFRDLESTTWPDGTVRPLSLPFRGRKNESREL